jgi:hypothetical protein
MVFQIADKLREIVYDFNLFAVCMDLCVLEASLVYIANFKPVRAMTSYLKKKRGGERGERGRGRERGERGEREGRGRRGEGRGRRGEGGEREGREERERGGRRERGERRGERGEEGGGRREEGGGRRERERIDIAESRQGRIRKPEGQERNDHDASALRVSRSQNKGKGVLTRASLSLQIK